MDKNFTKKLQNWLESPKESRNLDEGAMMLLQLTGNRIMYQNIMRNPKRYADHLEYELQKRLNFRVQQMTHEQVEQMAEKVSRIADRHLSLQESNPASEFQAGKRQDHDSLPQEIQALYVENKSIVQRMRAVHAELRVMQNRQGTCPDSDRYPFLKELIELDTRLHENWSKYDNYSAKAGAVIDRADAREASKRALAVINLNKKKLALNPENEKLRKRLADAYKLVINPSEKLQQELRELRVIQ